MGKQMSAGAAWPADPRTLHAAPLRVLAIGHTATYGEMVRQALRGLQPQIDAVPDEGTAWECLRCVPYDLIVLLFPWKAGDGLAACCRLRAVDQHVLVAVLHAGGTVDDVIAGLDAGADAYFNNPADSDEIRLHLAALLRRRSVRRAPAILQHATHHEPIAPDTPGLSWPARSAVAH